MTDANIDRTGPVVRLGELISEPLDGWLEVADFGEKYLDRLPDLPEETFSLYFTPEPTAMVDPDEVKERVISERVRYLQALLDVPAGIKQKLDGIEGLDPIYGVLIFVTKEEFDRLENRM